MPLSHVCVWDADIGYKRISLESACKMYPNGASAKSGYFVCELCAQNVLLTAPGVNVRHFRHDPSSPNKECDERQAHFDPLYGRRLRNLNSHLMPLRITVAKESFALQMGFFCPPDSEARCDKIRITTNSGKAYEYSFERIERGGTTYLNIGETPSREYNLEYINAAADLVKFWPSKVPGISSSGSFFDERTGQILPSGAKAYFGDSYYLLQSKPLGDPPTGLEVSEVLRTKTGSLATWYLYKIQIKRFSEITAKFFLKYAIFLTEHPTKFYPIWPAYIKEKIAGAQKNVAGFIADLSILLPQATSNESGWKYRHISAVYPEDEVGVSKDWKDELNELSQNLSYSLNVEPDLATMLAAFLYSAHIHNAPILIAGPCGQDIANALSVSLYADNAGQLMFGEQFDCDIADAVNNVNEHIVAAQNMFGKGWGDIIPQMLANSRKHIVWTHPYVEDLAIEPQGLYNYMLPVISECFVGTVSALEPYAGKRSEDFIGYVPKDTHPLRIAAFKKLGISKALLRQLSRVISDAKVMVDSPERAKDMEMLFGVMPICVLTGQLDVMREVLEAESGISSAVKAEAERYLKDE